jgi:hypothetical protein
MMTGVRGQADVRQLDSNDDSWYQQHDESVVTHVFNVLVACWGRARSGLRSASSFAVSLWAWTDMMTGVRGQADVRPLNGDDDSWH